MHIPTQSRLPGPAVRQYGVTVTRNSVASLRLLEHWKWASLTDSDFVLLPVLQLAHVRQRFKLVHQQGTS